MLAAVCSEVAEQQSRWSPFFGWESGGEGTTIIFKSQQQNGISSRNKIKPLHIFLLLGLNLDFL
ncbi:hypothetical protein C5167_044151 [Papaver somniferum]|uniref:Uncharacterized protein n=1 Tax=Papaver somniferum TaxID=3469 RepID=A0A4Y7LAA1_PAPSO|nr:hypothetical protein C5167_044151 [Papaver somniferum]